MRSTKLVSLALLLSGCAVEDGPAVGSTTGELGTVTSLRPSGKMVTGTGDNGIRLNGIRLNGIRLNGIRLNGIRLNGIRLNGLAGAEVQYFMHSTGQVVTVIPPVDKVQFESVFRYVVECALLPEQQVTMERENGEVVVLAGALGVAPGWADGLPTEADERRVSACLMARSNALGEPVEVSLRSADVPSTAKEIRKFDELEGAFWGNLFAEKDQAFACTGDAYAPEVGRMCAVDDRFVPIDTYPCGFNVVGSCRKLCTDGGEYLEGCGAGNSDGIMTVYLGKKVQAAPQLVAP